MRTTFDFHRNGQRPSAPVAIAAAALATLLLSCTPDVVLPNGAFSTIAFAADGSRLWVATASVEGSPRELYAYDLERKEIEWRRPLAGPAAVELEPGGALVVAEQVGRDAAISLFRADGGNRRDGARGCPQAHDPACVRPETRGRNGLRNDRTIRRRRP